MGKPRPFFSGPTGTTAGSAAIRALIVAIDPRLAAVVLSLPLLWILLALCLAPFWIEGPPAGAPEAAFRRSLDREAPRILRHYAVPGMAIGTVVHGDPGQVYVYGLADVAHGRPITRHTVFQVASISKSVSAWGVLTLVDAGKVDLDQPAERYVHPWPLAPSRYPASAVSLRRLLTHTAGLNPGEDQFRAPGEPQMTTAQLLARSATDAHGAPIPAALTAPVGGFVYSVPGYTLVQRLIEQETSLPFAAYMKAAILGPLGMTSSGFGWDGALRGRIATPYLTDGQAQPLRIPQDQAADGLFSTADDLVRFIAAPIAGHDLPVGAGVISRTAATQLFLRTTRNAGPAPMPVGPDAVCMGCFIEQRPGGPPFVTNAGNDPGWTSRIESAPTTGDGLVVLTNSSRGSPAIAQIEAMWATWRGLPPPPITRLYRLWGGYAVAAVYLIGLVAAGAGFACLSGIASGRRRFGGFTTGAAVMSLAEGLLAVGACRIWFLLRTVFELTPLFAVLARLSLGSLLLVLLARSFLPKQTPATP